jgi:fibronectin type 3 domain-containing protein
MDEREWREQFFGTAKVDGLEHLEVRDDQLQRPTGVGGDPNGSYLSKAFGPEDPDAAGNFHTLLCTARLGVDQSAKLQLLDATTLEPLAEVALVDGPNQWPLEGLLRLRYHPEVRVRVEAGGLDRPGDLAIDDVRLNWTERRHLPPSVVDSGLSHPSVHRTQGVDLWVEVYDEYDLADALTLVVEHRLEGGTEWSTSMLGPSGFQDGLWTTSVTPAIGAPTGTYLFRVNVTDTEGNFTGFRELPSRLEVLTHLPGEPRTMVGTAGDTRVDLEWSPPVDEGAGAVSSYRLFRGVSETSLGPLITLDASDLNYTDRDVTNGVTYYYAVLARNAFGDGPLGTVVDVTPLGPPGAPGSLVYDVGDENVTLRWSAPSEDGGARVAAYNVFRGEGPGALELVGELDPTVTVYVDEDVSAGTTYRYALTAVNTAGEGPLSRIVQVLAIGRPGSPTGLVAKELQGSVKVHWDAPSFDGGSGITGYVVLRGTSEADLVEVARVGTLVDFTDMDVKDGTTYYYRIAATNILGDGPRSDVVKVHLGEGSPGDPAIEPNYLVAASMLVMVGIGAVVASTESFKYWWGLSVVPLFTRIRKEGVLDNKTRLAIHGLVVENPGMHYSAILREFELSNGAAAYHLDVLERENFIRSVRDGRLKRFFSTETRISKEHGLTPEEMRGAIWDLVGLRPGISQKEIVYELGTSRDSTGYFLREMVGSGNLEASRKGKYTVYRHARKRPRY